MTQREFVRVRSMRRSFVRRSFAFCYRSSFVHVHVLLFVHAAQFVRSTFTFVHRYSNYSQFWLMVVLQAVPVPAVRILPAAPSSRDFLRMDPRCARTCPVRSHYPVESSPVDSTPDWCPGAQIGAVTCPVEWSQFWIAWTVRITQPCPACSSQVPSCPRRSGSARIDPVAQRALPPSPVDPVDRAADSMRPRPAAPRLLPRRAPPSSSVPRCPPVAVPSSTVPAFGLPVRLQVRIPSQFGLPAYRVPTAQPFRARSPALPSCPRSAFEFRAQRSRPAHGPARAALPFAAPRRAFLDPVLARPPFDCPCAWFICLCCRLPLVGLRCRSFVDVRTFTLPFTFARLAAFTFVRSFVDVRRSQLTPDPVDGLDYPVDSGPS